ncbi:MAG: signal peptide peptidase SppA [Acidobacteria bacterium RIFCSPLOWO2_02_FULL_68_18]|nr:MAG: signal peptide peptidase SppA [Acidobacteria bacterium RIFCSPLOWO2_02_FULL_68_18]OFW51539.1 MAG: signal peptide peptidase SppA [Acidobacteria bacterium RIFCSPLOWO2_12_FULL_68_19]
MALRRGIALVFILIGLAVIVSIAGILVLYALTARGPSVPERATLVLRPGGALLDRQPDDIVGQLAGRNAASLRGFVESLQKAKRDPRIAALLVRPSTLETPFWGKLQELRDAIVDFRRSGKPVVAYLEYGGDREYYLASAADRIFLLPTSPLDLTGIASYEIFLRGTLDRVGAYPDFLRIGAYKTAPNQLTERGFTPAHREMAESLNRDLYDQLVGTIAEARRKTVDEVRRLLDEGPFSADAARRAGLVDELGYLDELDDRVPALEGPDAGRRLVEESAYQRVSPAAAGIRPAARMAVLHLSGLIVSGRSTYDVVNGPATGSDSVVEQLQRIRDDDSVRAIVVRVDSPGGSAVASDVIWRELTITRDSRPSRPLVVSMSDLAASGGYYVSMPAHVIVAQPATLTGSIGIYAGKFALGAAMDKLGIATETVASGRNADINSPFTPFTPEQRAKVGEYMESFYDGFVQKAAASRRMRPAQLDAVAQGRVWTGRQAREVGLVDTLGGLDRAVAIAKERAGISADEDVELVSYPPRRTLFETLAEELQSSSAPVWERLVTGADLRAIAALTAPLRLFRRGEPLALMPGVFLR